jgi:hypothetical protein
VWEGEVEGWVKERRRGRGKGWEIVNFEKGEEYVEKEVECWDNVKGRGVFREGNLKKV